MYMDVTIEFEFTQASRIEADHLSCLCFAVWMLKIGHLFPALSKCGTCSSRLLIDEAGSFNLSSSTDMNFSSNKSDQSVLPLIAETS
jgi:hypothetical protein